MGTSSLYKGPKRAVLLPSDFNEDDESETVEGAIESEEGENPEEQDDGDAIPSDENDKEPENDEREERIVHYSFQSAKRNFTRSFGGNRDKIKTAVSGYIKSLGGSKQAAKQARVARQVSGSIYYLLTGSDAEKRRKFEELGIQVEHRPVKDVLVDICSCLAPIPDSLENTLVNNSLLDAMAEMSESMEMTEATFEMINREFLQKILSKFTVCYIFNKIMNDCSYGILGKCETVREIKNGEKQIKDYIEAIVEAVLPTYLTDDVTPSEINKAIEGMYEACYQEAERIK